jgi:hypothetical protein
VTTGRTRDGALDAAGDAQGGSELLATQPLATVTVLQAVPNGSSPQTVTVEVSLPPLPTPKAPQEELAVRIDDVPVDASAVGIAGARTSSIELPPGLASVELSALLSRTTGPQLQVPPWLRTTGPTPRATSPVPSAPRTAGRAADTALGGGSGLFGGHVPGTTGEVPRIEDGAAPTPTSWTSARGTRRDRLRQVTTDAARSLAARVLDGRSTRRDG